MSIALVELEQAQQVDEIALQEAPAAQVIELVLREAQPAKRTDLVTDLVHVRREIEAGIAALEAVFDLRARKVMQHHLHHGELVEVGVEQRMDDHAGGSRVVLMEPRGRSAAPGQRNGTPQAQPGQGGRVGRMTATLRYHPPRTCSRNP